MMKSVRPGAIYSQLPRFCVIVAVFLVGSANAAGPVTTNDQPIGNSSPFPAFFMTKLNVSNLKRSVEFYTNIMGLKQTERVETPDIIEILLTRSGKEPEDSLVLVFQKNRNEPYVIGNAFHNLTFAVSDLKGVLKRIAAAGYETSAPKGPFHSPVSFAATVTVAHAKDPDGIPLEIVEHH